MNNHIKRMNNYAHSAVIHDDYQTSFLKKWTLAKT